MSEMDSGSMIQELRMSTDQWIQIVGHLEDCLPEEGCGLIGGREGKATLILPVTNVLHSPVRYRMDPAEQVKAFVKIEQDGDELLAIFHSHPSGPAHPSETDVQEDHYPDVVHLIFYAESGKWVCRGYKIADVDTEITVLIND